MSQVSSPINSCIKEIDYSNSILDRIQNLSCNKFLCCWIVHKEKLITCKFRPSKNIRLIQINALWSSLCSIYSFLSIRNTLTRLCRILCLMKFHFIIATNIFAYNGSIHWTDIHSCLSNRRIHNLNLRCQMFYNS